MTLQKPIPYRIAALLTLALLATIHLAYILIRADTIPLPETGLVGQVDPDIWLRLTLVREWLMGGDWFSHAVTHTNAPIGGIDSPWTRPLDLVIAALVWLQPESIALDTRLMRAALILPLLWSTLLIAGMLRAVRMLTPMPAAAVMLGLLCVTVPMVWNYFSLGNADHHALLAVLFVWAIGGILNPNPSPRTMLISGILLGLQLWVNVEAFILIGLIYLGYGLNWLRGEVTAARHLSILAAGVAATAWIAIIIERGANGWATPIYDSISIAHAFTLSLALIVAIAVTRVRATRRRGRLIHGGAIASLALIAIGASYPALFKGPMVGMHPFILSDFLSRISEAEPFYKMSVLELMSATILPLCALILCLAPWIRPERSIYPPALSRTLAYLLVMTLLLYYTQQRWSYYLLPVAMIAIAPFLGALYAPDHADIRSRWPANMLAGLSPAQQAKKRLPITFMLLGAPILLILADAAPNIVRVLRNATIPSAINERDQCYDHARRLIRGGELTRILTTPTTIFTTTDLGAEILFFTPHRIVASNYHREGAGIQYVWNGQAMTDAAQLRTHLATRGIKALLVCPSPFATKNAIMNQLARGAKPPSWLTPIAVPLRSQIDADNPSQRARLFMVHAP